MPVSHEVLVVSKRTHPGQSASVSTVEEHLVRGNTKKHRIKRTAIFRYFPHGECAIICIEMGAFPKQPKTAIAKGGFTRAGQELYDWIAIEKVQKSGMLPGQK